MRSSKREVPLDGKGKEGGGKSGSKVPISLRNKDPNEDLKRLTTEELKGEFKKVKRQKRAAPRAVAKATDLYVSRKTNGVARLRRADKVLNEHGFVHLHGLGAAIGPCVDLALLMKYRHGDKIDWTIETSTVSLVDDLICEEMDDMEIRANSAIHIKVERV